MCTVGSQCENRLCAQENSTTCSSCICQLPALTDMDKIKAGSEHCFGVVGSAAPKDGEDEMFCWMEKNGKANVD